jgi:hypothetical protein
MEEVMNNKEAVPVLGMEVEISEAGVTETCEVSEVNTGGGTFSLDDKFGCRYISDRQNKELAKVGDKVIWNHD